MGSASCEYVRQLQVAAVASQVQVQVKVQIKKSRNSLPTLNNHSGISFAIIYHGTGLSQYIHG